jgi:hypothetical protein
VRAVFRGYYQPIHDIFLVLRGESVIDHWIAILTIATNKINMKLLLHDDDNEMTRMLQVRHI